MAGGGEGEVSLADRDFVGIVEDGGSEVALLDLCEGSSDVAGVDGDVNLVKGRKGRNFGFLFREGDFGFARIGTLIMPDPGCVWFDGDGGLPGVGESKDLGEVA